MLLHDSGGDRSHTVAALPELIDQLRAHGYKLVTVADLMGMTPRPGDAGHHRARGWS